LIEKIPRQQLLNAIDRMISDSLEDIVQGSCASGVLSTCLTIYLTI
jgi:hypothetical protein